MLKSLSIVAALLLTQFTSVIYAATWTGSINTDWFNSGNWSGTAPQSGGSALINNSGTVVIASPGAISTTVDMQNGVLNINGGTTTFTTSGQVIYGTGTGNPIVNQNAGTVTMNGSNYIGNSNDGGADTYNFNGGTFSAANLNIRQWGVFNHNVVGASPMNILGSLAIGNSTTGNSFYYLNGHELTIGGNLDLGNGGNTGSGTFDFGNVLTAKVNFTGGSGNGINIAGTNTFAVPVGLVNPLTIPGQSIVGTSDGFSVFNQQGGNVDFNGSLYISNSNDAKKDQYNFNGGTLQIQNLFARQWGEFNHNNAGAVLDIVGSLAVGDTTTGNSFFNLNGNEMNIGGNLNVGVGTNTGIGTFNFGNVNTAKINFTGGSGNGINIAGTNTFVVPLGLVNAITIPGQSIVGTADGFSAFNQQGGNLDFNGTLYISNNNDGKKDQYNFSGGTLQIQNLNVRQWGEFNHNNPGTVLDIVGSITMGDTTTGNSYFNLNGNEVKLGGNLTIGTANNTGSSTFTFGNPATAKLTFTGGSGNGINVGGLNTLVIPAGLVNPIVVPGQSIIGNASGGESIYQQDGGTVSFNGALYIANTVNAGGETDKVILNGGTLNLNGISSSINLQTRGKIIVNGGTLNAKVFNIGNIAGYAAGFESTGGTSNFAGTVKLDPVGDAQVDYINISGGTVNITGAGNDLELHGTGTATISGGLTNVADDFLIGTRASHVATVNQTGGRVVVADTLQLATIASSNGIYNLSGGELKVGTLDLTNLGNDSFNLNGGKLSAVVVDNTDNILNFTSGMLSPGLANTPGTMTFNTGLTIPAAGGLQIDLYQPNTLGGPNDLLVVNGDLVLDGILSVNSDVPVGVFPFLTFTGNLDDQGLDVFYPLTQSIFIELNQFGGGTVYLMVIPVPEPSSMLLLVGMGLIGLQARRRSRRAA